MKWIFAVILLIGSFAVVGGASAQTAIEKSLVYRKVDVQIPEVWNRATAADACTRGDSCDDHDDCTDDFCDFSATAKFQQEQLHGVCRHETNDHCSGPPLAYKIVPFDRPVPTAETPPVAAQPEPPPAPETPTVPETQPEPRPEPQELPQPEPAPSISLKFDCSAAPEDTIMMDGQEVIFPIDAKGKRTLIALKARASANGTPSALATTLSGAETIELKQTGGSELVLVKSTDGETPVGGALVVDASGEAGLVPTDFSFDAPIPVAPDRGGVEVYSFTATLVDAEGRTLASAVADCRVGLQIKGGGSLGGCSLVDGEFETQQVFGMFVVFLFAWGVLLLAERLKRWKK
jgi:hypothetical protein